MAFRHKTISQLTGVLACHKRMFTFRPYVSVVVSLNDLGPNASDERIRVAAAGDLSGSEISPALIGARLRTKVELDLGCWN